MNWNRSEELFKKALTLMPGGVNSPVRAFRSVGGSPFFTEQAQGSRLTTVDGNELIDFVGTWGPAIHGHNHPKIRAAIAEALNKGTSFGTPNLYEIELAERVKKWVPSVEKVRLCNSGTEATMSCIRLARGATGRPKVIKFEGCYHGHVDSLLVKAGSGALTLGHPDSAGVPAGFAAETIVLPYNDLAAVEEAFDANPEQIAGIIIEPFPANCGLILPDADYLHGLRRVCTENGSVLIFDEVMTGFRLARGGVQELTGVTPDLTAMGKVIGGGLPVGALGGKAELMDLLAPLGPVYQAGTLSGNPLAMAAGIAALDLLDETDPYADLDRKGTDIRNALLQAAEAKGIALQVPQVGSMFCLFFSEKPVRSGAEATQTKVDLFPGLFRYALDNGVFLPPSAYETCFIATAHSDEDISRTLEVLTAGIQQI